MSYKIAIGSSDGIHVDLKFGEVNKFLIYEVDKEARLVEERSVETDINSDNESIDNVGSDNKILDKGAEQGCVDQKSCGQGCGGQGNGCSGPDGIISKVAIIADCRCVVCKKIGFQAQKQFEKKAISVFDVECTVEEALNKISYYYNKIDNHESFKHVNH